MFQWYSMVKSQTGEVEERMGNEEEIGTSISSLIKCRALCK